MEKQEGLVELEVKESKDVDMTIEDIEIVPDALPSEIVQQLDKGTFYVVDAFDIENPIFVNALEGDTTPAKFDSYKEAKNFADVECQVPVVVRYPAPDENGDRFNPVMVALNNRLVTTLDTTIDDDIIDDSDRIEYLESALEIVEYFK